jgi:hypothetical protein
MVSKTIPLSCRKRLANEKSFELHIHNTINYNKLYITAQLCCLEKDVTTLQDLHQMVYEDTPKRASLGYGTDATPSSGQIFQRDIEMFCRSYQEVLPRQP